MQRIVLTGTPITGLRLVSSMTPKKGGFKVFSFDMRESGAPAPPRYLPKGDELKFTIYINEKQLKNVELDNTNIKSTKIILQGELTLSVPHSECFGDMGVICYTIHKLLPRPAAEVSEPEEIAENKEELIDG